MDNSVGAFGQQPAGFSGRMVSFSFKVEKSQLLSPKQTDYVIVNQDGSHCGGSVKFNGIVETSAQPTHSSFPPVKCELAPEYSGAVPQIKSEPDQYLANHTLNDSGFSEMGLEHQLAESTSQTVVPKMEPGLGQ